MTDKILLQSSNIVNKNVEQLALLFPNCITESANGKAIDFDLLKQELSNQLIDGAKERYRMEWPGKREAIVNANLPTSKTLRPLKGDSVDFDNTENVYLEGDNLEVLKLLQESYLGKVKMIYIDPPYNTGKDFVYKDNFAIEATEYKDENEKDEYGQRMFINSESGGRYHSDWLSMMYPRLKLARNLLTDDGVIFISIDDREVHNLRKLCDEVFGENNFVAGIIWEKKFSPQNDAKHFSDNHDNVLVYGKYKDILKINLLPRKEEHDIRYKNIDNDSRGIWTSSDLSVRRVTEKDIYEIVTPSGKSILPSKGRSWSVSKEKFEQLRLENRIWFGDKNDSVPRLKRFLTDVQHGIVPLTIFKHTEVGHNQEAQQELKEIFDGESYFDSPKPIRLLKKLCHLGSQKNDITLDFFSGSATTAHAIMQLNAEDGGNRRYIMVQVPEAVDEKSEAFKAGYKTICEIGKERIRRAGGKIKEELSAEITGVTRKYNNAVIELGEELNRLLKSPDRISALSAEIEELTSMLESKKAILNKLDTGFRVYRLADSNMKDVYYRPQDFKQEQLDFFAENIKEDRSAEDLLVQVMLSWGLPLNCKTEVLDIAGKKVFKVAENALMACFDNGINEVFAKAISVYQPPKVVFKDASFADNNAKENVKQLLKQMSAGTEMKVI